MLTDSNGRIIWYRDYKYIDYPLTQALINISYTKKGQILLSGQVAANHAIPGVFDTAGGISWFVLTDSFGCMVGGC